MMSKREKKTEETLYLNHAGILSSSNRIHQSHNSIQSYKYESAASLDF